MKIRPVILLILLLCGQLTYAQITTAIIKANFGVDADLRSNYFNGLVQAGNDDWFLYPGTPGTGQYIIDTTGAALMLAQYAAIPDSRKLPFFRNMRYPAYTVVNNRLLVDAYFVRDYHGDDSTIFASGSNKNGMSPSDWSCPVSQSIPDKNEILDVLIHVRRAGPNVTDSMWLFGGISIENTTGNRYFDFELYQTDIYYDRATRKFYNYGPDAGHTRWQFDAAGNMLAPGDIILTAEYSSSSLTMVQARIWVDQADMAINPVGFDWTGTFDGAGSGAQYGYAGIQPETAGAFYTGLQSVNNTWAGPFALVLGDNSVQTNYSARQFMEFSVNMSKLGLDNSKIFGGDDCEMPFRRVIVKTRASTSFTAELKDFVAPFDFFIAPAANIESTTPMICDTGSVSIISVTNPIPTSIYQWSTPNGHILGPTTGTFIAVDTPGTYIVRQYLQAACDVYATDTIEIGRLVDCNVLANNLVDFRLVKQTDRFLLSWKVMENRLANGFWLEYSTDGTTFSPLQWIAADENTSGNKVYQVETDQSVNDNRPVWFRVRMIEPGNRSVLSPALLYRNTALNSTGLLVYPNPVRDQLQLSYKAATAGNGILVMYDQSGRQVLQQQLWYSPGTNQFSIPDMRKYPAGLYQLSLHTAGTITTQKIIITR